MVAVYISAPVTYMPFPDFNPGMLPCGWEAPSVAPALGSASFRVGSRKSVPYSHYRTAYILAHSPKQFLPQKPQGTEVVTIFLLKPLLNHHDHFFKLNL